MKYNLMMSMKIQPDIICFSIYVYMTNITPLQRSIITAQLISAYVTDDNIELTQMYRQQRRPGDRFILEAALPPRRNAKVTPDGAILCSSIHEVGDVTSVGTCSKRYHIQDTRGETCSVHQKLRSSIDAYHKRYTVHQYLPQAIHRNTYREQYDVRQYIS